MGHRSVTKRSPVLHLQDWVPVIETWWLTAGRPTRSALPGGILPEGLLTWIRQRKGVVVWTRQPWGQILFLPVSSYLVAFLSESLLASKIWNNKFGCDDQKRSSGPQLQALASLGQEPPVSRGGPIWRAQNTTTHTVRRDAEDTEWLSGI